MTQKPIPAPTFSLILRTIWIDDVIEEEGEIRRADICRAFMVSVPQASIDLQRYQRLHPGRIGYDRSAKCYYRIQGTQPLFHRGARAASAEIVRQIADMIESAGLAKPQGGA